MSARVLQTFDASLDFGTGCFYPVSIIRAERIIVAAKQVFDDAIIDNVMPVNETAPFTMCGLRNSKSEANDEYWKDARKSQLDAVYSCLQDAVGIPEREAVSKVTRSFPMTWSPTDDFARSDRQSEESFHEQRRAVDLMVRQISRYRAAGERGRRAYVKNPIVYGAPGAGKSFVGSLSVLYALSQGLNVISTALMGLRAQALGGTHLHELFKLPASDASRMNPPQAANAYLEKIRKKTN